MAQIRVLDARNMMMPEPLLATLEALDSLQPGVCLRLQIDRDPLLLYPLLGEYGFRHIHMSGASTGHEVMIWRAGDSTVESAVDAIRSSLT